MNEQTGTADKLKTTALEPDNAAAGVAAERYLDDIEAALKALAVYLRDEIDSPLYQHELTGRILTSYIDRLTHSFSAWENRLSFADTFRINRAESGYPLHRAVLELERDARDAQKQLAQLPDGEALRREMIDCILLARKFPAEAGQCLSTLHPADDGESLLLRENQTPALRGALGCV